MKKENIIRQKQSESFQIYKFNYLGQTISHFNPIPAEVLENQDTLGGGSI